MRASERQSRDGGAALRGFVVLPRSERGATMIEMTSLQASVYSRRNIQRRGEDVWYHCDLENAEEKVVTAALR